MKKQRIYIVRTYVLAGSVAEAIRKSKGREPDDAFLEETCQKNLIESMHKNGGFKGFV